MCVTVIMSVHNGAATVAKAITSIQAQTYADWRLIIVDDASSDGTLDAILRPAADDARIRVLRNPRNIGLAASLNRAWQQADSELIARMDADDTSLPHRLAAQVQFMSQHPDVAVLGAGAELCNAHGESLGVALRPERHEQLVQRIWYENPFIHPTVMVRRDFLVELGGYDSGLRRAQDYDLWLRACDRFCFHNLREPLIRYRVPERISAGMIYWGTYVLLSGAWRHGCHAAALWYPWRYLVATTLTKCGVWNTRLR